jgi:Protein of unknown function (DUF3307)
MTTYIFLVLFLLQIKHWYIDFVNQSAEEIKRKGTYLDCRGIQHSIKHGTATAVIFCLFISIAGAVLLGLIDFLLHYHIDWAKINITKKYNYTSDNPKFWMWLGLDQLAHQITYLGLVSLLV